MRHLAWKYMPAINWLMQDVLRSLLSRQWMVSRDFLAHHANVVAAIIPGEMRFEDADGNEYVFAVSSGFVEMINNRAKLFCLSVESPDEIDIRPCSGSKGTCRRAASSETEHPGVSYEPDGTCESDDTS